MKFSTAIILSLALTGASFADEFGKTECDYNKPFQVLNGSTGQYQSITVKGDRGWCRHSQDGIENGAFSPDGGESDTAEAESTSTEAK